MQYEEEISS